MNRKKRGQTPNSHEQEIDWVKAMLLIFAFAFAGYSIVSGTVAIIECFEAESWPTAPAVITSSRLIKCGKSGQLQCPSVSYAFTVNGAEFNGNRIDLSPYYSGPASEALKGLGLGALVPVRYSPADPHKSVLRLKGQFWWYWSMLLFGGFILLKAVIEFRRFWVPGEQKPDIWAGSERNRLQRADVVMEIEIRERLRDKAL